MKSKNKKLDKYICESDLQAICAFLKNHHKSRHLRLINRIINRYSEEYGTMI